MSFETLKATINSNIVSGLPDGIRADYENNPTLQDIVSAFGQDYIYMGSATVGTSPMTDDNARMYISSGSGEFTAFRDSGNNAINISKGEIAILKGISGVYEKDVFFSGDIAVEAGSVRINDTGSLMQLQAKYDGSWLTISEFGYVGGDITLQDVQASSVTANSVVINGDVESGYNTEVKDYLCIGGEVIVPQNEYLYADDFVEDRLESTTGEYIPNTASNSLAVIGMDTINDKCVLYNEAVTSKEDVIESIIPNSTDGDFDVTRSSYTNRVNRDGFIEQVPPNTASYNYTSGDTHPYLLTEAASTNLLTYPKSFGNSYWTKSGADIKGDSSTAGSELMPNQSDRDFSAANAWSNFSMATYNEIGDLSITSNASSQKAGLDIVNAPMSSGNDYIVTVTATNFSGGSFTLKNRVESQTIGTLDADGTFVFHFRCESSGGFMIISTGTGAIDLDNFSVKEVQGFEAPKEKPTVASELVTNGDFDGNADGWYLGVGWAYGTNNVVATTASEWIRQDISAMESNKNYIVTYEISNYSAGSVMWRYGTTSTIDGTSRSANGTYSEYFNNTTSGDKRLWLEPSGFTGTIDNVSVKEVTSWSGGGFETEAFKLAEDTSNGTHNISVQVGTADGNSNTASVYVKYANETKIIALSNGTLSTELIKVDISNGTLFSEGSSVDDYAITYLANGWYRLSVTTTNATRKIIISQLTDGGLTNYQGDGTSGLYIAYAQLEEQASATSLILPTTEGSTTSRVADAVTNGGSQALFGGVNASGVLYAEIAALSQSGDDVRISISNGSETDRLSISYTGDTNEIQLFMNAGNSTQANEKVTLTNVTSFSKIAARWAENDISLWVDGVELATDTSASTFAANILSVLNFNYCVAPHNAFYGKAKGVAVFNYLSDTEMTKLTTV